jgi:ribosomal protein S18 acetylase RimI-like enzyme
VVLDCGWGRLVFGQTFTDQAAVADVLRSEAAGARDICIYLRDPHVLVSRLPDELFIDPSLTYRLPLGPARPAIADRQADIPGLRIRRLRDAADAEAVNRIYASNGMVAAPVEVLVANAATDHFLHLVAEAATGEIVGTITGVDHVEVFADPENGASLWCLTVDFNHAPPGTGQALLLELADRLTTRGRAFVDLSVLAENVGAIRLYERLGFYRTACLRKGRTGSTSGFSSSHPGGTMRNLHADHHDEAMRRGVRGRSPTRLGRAAPTKGGRTIHSRESLRADLGGGDEPLRRRGSPAASSRRWRPRGRTAIGEPTRHPRSARSVAGLGRAGQRHHRRPHPEALTPRRLARGTA